MTIIEVKSLWCKRSSKEVVVRVIQSNVKYVHYVFVTENSMGGILTREDFAKFLQALYEVLTSVGQCMGVGDRPMNPDTIARLYALAALLSGDLPWSAEFSAMRFFRSRCVVLTWIT